jgi:hypothetical protein
MRTNRSTAPRGFAFGTRGIEDPPADISADDIWRAVAALHRLSPSAREDGGARYAVLFHALRHFHPLDRIDAVVEAVENRLLAFQRMIADEPGLLPDDIVDSAIEDAVYETIATLPLCHVGDELRFDPRVFSETLPRFLREELNARARDAQRREGARPALFVDSVH